MNNRLEIIDMLYQLSAISSKLANALEKAHNDIPLPKDVPVYFPIEPLKEEHLAAWPKTNTCSDPLYLLPLADGSTSVLEMVPILNEPLKDLLADNRTVYSREYHEPKAGKNFRRIIELPDEKYDIIILNHFLELNPSPLSVLQRCKDSLNENGLIYVISRPWTSSDGGYQSTYYDRAYYHLCYELEHNNKISNKFTRPQAQLRQLFSAAGLTVMAQHIHNIELPEFIQNEEVLKRIIYKTWGALDSQEAMQILKTSKLEYILCPST